MESVKIDQKCFKMGKVLLLNFKRNLFFGWEVFIVWTIRTIWGMFQFRVCSGVIVMSRRCFMIRLWSRWRGNCKSERSRFRGRRGDIFFIRRGNLWWVMIRWNVGIVHNGSIREISRVCNKSVGISKIYQFCTKSGGVGGSSIVIIKSDGSGLIEQFLVLRIKIIMRRQLKYLRLQVETLWNWDFRIFLDGSKI